MGIKGNGGIWRAFWTRIPQLRTIAQNTRASVDWLEIYARALENRPEGMFSRELTLWHAANMNSDADKRSRENEREFSDGMGISTAAFTQWHLVTSKQEYPDRVYPNSRFSTFPEPCVRITPKGLSLAKRPMWRQRMFFGLRFGWEILEGYLKVLRGPLAVASFLLTALKFGAQWSNVHAAIGAISGGLATLLFAVAHHVSTDR